MITPPGGGDAVGERVGGCCSLVESYSASSEAMMGECTSVSMGFATVVLPLSTTEVPLARA